MIFVRIQDTVGSKTAGMKQININPIIEGILPKSDNNFQYLIQKMPRLIFVIS